MARRKRPQILENQLAAVNEWLSRNEVKSQDNELFSFWCDWLIQNKYYRGFNFYVNKVISTTEGPKSGLVLAGSSDPAKYDCLQIW